MEGGGRREEGDEEQDKEEEEVQEEGKEEETSEPLHFQSVHQLRILAELAVRDSHLVFSGPCAKSRGCVLLH